MATAQETYITYTRAAQEVAALEAEQAGLAGKIRAASSASDQETVSRLLARQTMIPILLDAARAEALVARVPALEADADRIAVDLAAASKRLSDAQQVLTDAQDTFNRAAAALHALQDERRRIWLALRNARRAQQAAAAPVGVA